VTDDIGKSRQARLGRKSVIGGRREEKRADGTGEKKRQPGARTLLARSVEVGPREGEPTGDSTRQRGNKGEAKKGRSTTKRRRGERKKLSGAPPNPPIRFKERERVIEERKDKLRVSGGPPPEASTFYSRSKKKKQK